MQRPYLAELQGVSSRRIYSGEVKAKDKSNTLRTEQIDAKSVVQVKYNWLLQDTS